MAKNTSSQSSSFLDAFYKLRGLQVNSFPQIQLSESERRDLQNFLEEHDYTCVCEPYYFLASKKDQWTVCSYQYLAFAAAAYKFTKNIKPYYDFLISLKENQDALKLLHEIKTSIKTKKGKKGKKASDDVDEDETTLDKAQTLKLLNDANVQAKINNIGPFNSYNGDKNSLRDFILNPNTKQFIQKDGEKYKLRNDIFSACVNSAFPIVVSNNGFLGDFIELLAKNDEYFNKIINIVDNIKKRDEKISKELPLQKIFFGAPGTGKSYTIDHKLFEDDNGAKYGLKKLSNPVFRTTFHPDYDYAQFVGAYKPKDVKNISILRKKELLDELQKLQEEDSTYAIHKFTALHFESLEKLSKEDKKELFDKANVKPSMQDVEYRKGIAVGEYMAQNKNTSSISYSFVPQIFAKAYATAWHRFLNAGQEIGSKDQVFLVIEEINRGNCAQIFGDIFQLLDRDEHGFSCYSIDIDHDFANWLKTDSKYGLKNDWKKYIANPHVKDGKMALPPNLNILATMNTSDQSLFPMDSAFKRRFDWEYVPISFMDEDGKEKEAASYEIEIFDESGAPCKREGGKPYLWKDFVDAVNDKILTLTESEDKQLGEFFIKPNKKNEKGEYVVISCERFLGKVMFYLWNEVCKDEHKNGSFFRAKINDKEDFFTFQDLYKKEKNGYLKQFMDELLKKE